MSNIVSVLKGSFSKIKLATENFLETPSDIEYLFVSIYRINFTKADRDILMKDIIFHLDNPDGAVLTDVRLVGRFSTLYNNRILGLEVQNASIYGQKIEMAFDDFDRQLATEIRKNDIIIIHRINSKKLKMADAVATLIGLSTYFPSGIKESTLKISSSSSVKEKFSKSITKKTDLLVNKFLTREKPIFSGIITLPQSVMGNSIKLTVEGQDMIRIMQHINTEERTKSEIKNLPEDLDVFFSETSQTIKVKGDDHLSILHSTILKTLGSAVYEEIVSNGDIEEVRKKNISFFIEGRIAGMRGQVPDSHDSILVRVISNGMFMIHISPLRALKLFVKYYAKNTGISTFFDFDVWDTSFFNDKKIVEEIFKRIFKDLADVNPYFTFGMMLNFSKDKDIVPYATNEAENDQSVFNLFVKFPLRNVFTEKTFNNIFKNRVNEGIIVRYLNSDKEVKENPHEWLLSEFFMHLINPVSVDKLTNTGLLEGDIKMFLNNDNDENTSFIISKEARQLFHERLNEMKDDFSNTISLDYVVSTNFSSVRSTEFNPVLTNQMKSVPIIQILQLFIGAMTVIPISQSTKLTGFDNTAHNISQRIWLSSAIGFKHPSTGEQSWIHKNGFKPTIFFGLNYKQALIERIDETGITYMSDKDIINSKMFTLPSVGSLAIYQWGIEDIHIGYSKYNEGDLDDPNNIPQLSMGGSMVFDLSSIADNADNYVSENDNRQIGGSLGRTPTIIPRIAMFVLEDGRDEQNIVIPASEELKLYDDFGQITVENQSKYYVYLGYDMYAMNGEPSTIKLANNGEVRLYSPIISGNNPLIDDLGRNIFNTNSPNVKAIWADTEGDFPSDNKAKIGSSNKRVVVTGIKDYYDPSKFLPILKSFQHFIKLGFTGVSGEGDNNLYADEKLFKVYHNMRINEDYIETFKPSDEKELKSESLSKIVEEFISWISGRFINNDRAKRRMMIKYARNISVIKVSDMNGDEAPFRTGNLFHPPSLLSAIEPYTIESGKAIKTINILSSFVRSISHYMNRVAKENTTGGVLYCPFKNRKDGTIFEIGDAISFSKVSDNSDISKFKKFVKTFALTENKPKTNLDIYKKIYYVWKITYYFGGAGTDPSGSSGSTMRIYLTDSGIHWNSSYEEKDITTRIAESLMLNRLAVKL